jgi:type I restriction enzyme M protein
MVDRTRKEFSDADIAKITRAYHAWRGEADAGIYEDIPGFRKSAPLEEIRGHGYVLTPGRYVGAADVKDDDMPFAERFIGFRTTLEAQFDAAVQQQSKIKQMLSRLA